MSFKRRCANPPELLYFQIAYDVEMDRTLNKQGLHPPVIRYKS